ncbi:MAG: hypothetical protein Q8P67_26625, partial [archaeon]|nr:hypothetical protein [archaeon]
MTNATPRGGEDAKSRRGGFREGEGADLVRGFSPQSAEQQYLALLAIRTAPEIRFHSKEELFPCDVDWCLSRCSLCYSAAAIQKIKADDVTLLDAVGSSRDLVSQTILGDPSGCRPQETHAATPTTSFYLRYRPRERADARNGQKTGLDSIRLYCQVVESPDEGLVELRYWLLFGSRGKRFSLFSDPSDGPHWAFIAAVLQTGSRFGARLLRLYLTSGEEPPADARWYVQEDQAAGYRLTADGHPIVYCALRTHAFYPRPGSFSRGVLHADDLTDDSGVVWQTWRSPLVQVPSLLFSSSTTASSSTLSSSSCPVSSAFSSSDSISNAALLTSETMWMLYRGRWSPATGDGFEAHSPPYWKVYRSLPAPTPANTHPPDPHDHICCGLSTDHTRRVRISNTLSRFIPVQRWVSIPTPFSARLLSVGKISVFSSPSLDPSSPSSSLFGSSSTGLPTPPSHSSSSMPPPRDVVLVWAIDQQDDVHLFSEASMQWLPMRVKMRCISCGNDGTVWAVGRHHQIYRLSSSRLQRIASSLQSTDASASTSSSSSMTAPPLHVISSSLSLPSPAPQPPSLPDPPLFEEYTSSSSSDDDDEEEDD